MLPPGSASWMGSCPDTVSAAPTSVSHCQNDIPLGNAWSTCPTKSAACHRRGPDDFQTTVFSNVPRTPSRSQA